MLDDNTLRIVLDVVLAAALVGAVITDGRTRRIPNKLTVPVALLGVVLNAAAHGLPGLGASLGGLATGLALLIPVWMAGGSGAGDVKLLGMVGALRGVQFVIWTALLGAITGGVLALIALAYHRRALAVLRNVGAFFYRVLVLRGPGGIEPTEGSFKMRYAFAIAMGALLAALWR